MPLTNGVIGRLGGDGAVSVVTKRSRKYKERSLRAALYRFDSADG